MLMDTSSNFFNFLNKFAPLDQEEYDKFLAPYVVIRNFGKKEIITHQGEIEEYFNFILKGLARKYFRKGNEELNSQISFEGHIIHSQESFHSRTPSDYFVEAIEPVMLASITYKDLENAYSKSRKLEHLGRIVITTAMVLKDRWQSQLVMLTPRERFILFVNKHPELLQRVPQKYLASYLNIKPETFSRFKHLVKGYSKAALN